MNAGRNGRVALVLGGSRGLGFGVAQALASRGATVAIVGRDRAALAASVERIRATGGRGEGFVADLADEGRVDRLVEEVRACLGEPDILLLNGGGPPPFRASSYDPALWRDQVAAMLLNQIKVAALCLPAMRRRGWGRILVVSSTSAREPIRDLTASNALRAALAGWAKTLATEVAPEGVTVNLLLPGRFATERTQRLDALDAEDRGVDPSVIAGESQAEIPLGRYGTAEEFGEVAAFLASDAGSYVTGIALPVDGGLSRGIL